MQIWPWCRNAPNAAALTAYSRSASAEHDQRVVAAELEHDALQVAAGGLGELAAGRRRAGEVDPAHRRVLDELVADRPGLARRVRDDVQHARRQPRLGEDLAPDQAADDRRPLGRLQHDGVAERERRGDRARREDQRRVPRRDRADDADRLADAHRERARDVGRDDLADRRVRERRRLAEEAGHEVHLEHAEAEAAPVSRASSATTSSRRLSRMSAALRKIRCRCAGGACDHAANAVGRGVDRAPRVLAAAGGDARDDVAGERVAVVERRAAGAQSADCRAPSSRHCVSCAHVISSFLSSSAARA